MDALARLASRKLLLVTGKGGVGKTLLTAVLARALARDGRRVLAVEVDPRENLHAMLGVAPTGGEIAPVGRGLSIQNLRPRTVIDELVRERVKIGFVVRRVLRSPVYQTFAEGAPGIPELAVLGHAFLQVAPPDGRRAEFDAVVLDAPATGHGLALLAAPGLVSQVIQSGPFGEMARELAAFVGDPSRTGVALATEAEEMPVDEVLELARALASGGGMSMARAAAGAPAAAGVDVATSPRREPDLLVVNRLYPEAPSPRPSDELGSLWYDRRKVNESELARLRAGWPAEWRTPIVELPLLALPSGPALVGALEQRLERALAAEGRA